MISIIFILVYIFIIILHFFKYLLFLYTNLNLNIISRYYICSLVHFHFLSFISFCAFAIFIILKYFYIVLRFLFRFESFQHIALRQHFYVFNLFIYILFQL